MASQASLLLFHPLSVFAYFLPKQRPLSQFPYPMACTLLFAFTLFCLSSVFTSLSFPKEPLLFFTAQTTSTLLLPSLLLPNTLILTMNLFTFLYSAVIAGSGYVFIYEYLELGAANEENM